MGGEDIRQSDIGTLCWTIDKSMEWNPQHLREWILIFLAYKDDKAQDSLGFSAYQVREDFR